MDHNTFELGTVELHPLNEKNYMGYNS